MIRRFIAPVFIFLLTLTALCAPANSFAKSKRAVAKQQQAPVVLGKRGDITSVKTRISGVTNCTAKIKKSEKGAVTATNSPANKLPISSKSAIILDGDGGEVLFAKDPDQPRQPASTIKIITGLIAINSLKDSDQVRVSPKASAMPRSKIDITPNKVYRADDMINAILLASANDASVAVAETIAGSEEKFATLMTNRANLWGATKTVCRTANGLTAEGQYSTARDLATIFQYAMKNEEFARRMRHQTAITSYGKQLRNHNKALWQVDGALGGKTGFTNAARQTYVGQFSRNGHTITVALMGSETMWNDLKQLVEYGFRKKEQLQLAEASPGSATTRQVN